MSLFDRLRFQLTGQPPSSFYEPGPEVKAVPLTATPAPPPAEVKGVSYTGDADVAGSSVAVHGGGAPRTSWSERKAIGEGFTVSTWVFACIHRIAKSAASVPWVVDRRNADGSWEAIPGHPLEKLISRPNPMQSRQDVIERLTYHLFLAGNGLVHKARGLRNVPRELWLLSPDVCRPEADDVELIKHYWLTKRRGGRKALPVEDVCHVQFTNPANPLWGMSPLQVAARAVDSDVAAQDWQWNSMQNRATPDGVLSFKQPLSKKQHEQAVEQVATARSGSGNARSVIVLGGEANWHQLSLSPVEMDFLESRAMNREEICAVFQVPPVMIGIYENATLANLEASRAIFWLETMVPYLDDIAEALTRSLAPDFELGGAELRVRPDLSGVSALRALTRESSSAATAFWNMGVPFNIINERLHLGFPHVPGGDSGFVNGGVVPATMLDPNYSGPGFLDIEDGGPEPEVDEGAPEEDDEAVANREADGTA